MHLLCEWLTMIAQGKCPTLHVPGFFEEEAVKKPTACIVVLPPMAQDTRGMNLNHLSRLRSALKRHLKVQLDHVDPDEERFYDPVTEAVPSSAGTMRMFIVREITPGQFQMPKKAVTIRAQDP